MTRPGSNLDPFKSWLITWGPLIVLILVSAMFYLSTQKYECSWDDALFLVRSPEMGRLSNLSKVFTVDYFGLTENPALSGGTPLYRPLSLGFLILESWRFGTNIDGFRLVHMAWHLMNIALLFAFVRKMLGGSSVFGPFAAAAVLAFLPYTVDTVLFLTSVSDLMVLSFSLFASILFLDWLTHAKLWRLACVILLSLAAMLCKESAVSLTVLLPIIFWCRRESRLQDRRALAAILGVVSAAAAFLVVRSFVVQGLPATALVAFFKQLPAALAAGIRWAVIPFPLVLEQRLDPRIGDTGWWFGCGVLVLASGLLVRYGKRFKLLTAGGMVWFVAVLPSFIALHWTGIFAPRYLYFPVLGLSLVVGYLASIRLRSVRILLCVMLLLAAISTVGRIASWKDSLTLWAVEVGHQPESVSALMNLGNILAKRGDYNDALALQLKTAAVARNQNQPCVAAFAYSNAATILSSHLNDPEQGIRLYRQCIALCPPSAQNAWIGMARLYAGQKKWKEAERAIREAEKFSGQKVQVLVFLAGILAADGRPAEALECLEKARALVLPNSREFGDIDKKIEAIRNMDRKL
ncbi:MAG: tetratricopeptide repeat protein [Proteobacteria bacterium]|nr:tetratricopeptide repeat protein [Pseudomonadota bacterium]